MTRSTKSHNFNPPTEVGGCFQIQPPVLSIGDLNDLIFTSEGRPRLSASEYGCSEYRLQAGFFLKRVGVKKEKARLKAVL